MGMLFREGLNKKTPYNYRNLNNYVHVVPPSITLYNYYIQYCVYGIAVGVPRISCRELKKDFPTRGLLGYLCCCFWRRPQAQVTVHLEDAHDLKKQDITGAGVCVWYPLIASSVCCVCVCLCVC